MKERDTPSKKLKKYHIVRCFDCKVERGYYECHYKKLKTPYRCRLCSLPHRRKVKYWLGKHHDEKTIEKIKIARKKQLPYWTGRIRSSETALKISTRLKELWKNESYRKLMSDAHKNYTKEQLRNILTRRVPSKPEEELGLLLNTHFPNDWKYVGDGTLVIGGRNPDFAHTRKKIILEMFGDHWHDKSEVEPRISFFEEFGYKTGVIWASDLRSPNLVLEKIRNLL